MMEEHTAMKIAFSSSGNTTEAPLDGRFGRAMSFLVVDSETGATKVIDNASGVSAVQGAGAQAAAAVSESGATAVVAVHCGPRAFMALKAAGIRVYVSSAETVAEALELFLAGELEEMKEADTAGHVL